MIPGESFTRLAKFKGIVSVNDFWFPRRLQELLQALLGLLGSFVFRVYDCYHCTAKSCTTTHIGDCCAIHFLDCEFCDLQLSSHQMFPLWARLYQHVFCKKTSLFTSSSIYRNWGPSESACRHCAHSNPVPLLLATPLVIDENWKCLGIQAVGFFVALKDNVHRPNSL